MRCFLMRHGEAELYAASDQTRALTFQGVERLKHQLQALQGQLGEIEQIVHSPYLRAQQTAALVADTIGITESNIVISELWTPDSDPHAALAMLEAYTDKTTLVVTHMPLISLVEALWLGETLYPQAFACGEISRISADWPAAGLACHKRLSISV